jgi:hypothetical protein
MTAGKNNQKFMPQGVSLTNFGGFSTFLGSISNDFSYKRSDISRSPLSPNGFKFTRKVCNKSIQTYMSYNSIQFFEAKMHRRLSMRKWLNKPSKVVKTRPSNYG